MSAALPPSPRSALTVVVLATLALAAFAGNSLLCRLALAGWRIDAGTFTAVRITSGALMLIALVALRGGAGGGRAGARAGSWARRSRCSCTRRRSRSPTSSSGPGWAR